MFEKCQRSSKLDYITNEGAQKELIFFQYVYGRTDKIKMITPLQVN